MPGRIFISYRRGDEPGFALALYGRLEQSFPPEHLFMDVEGGIRAGDDFVKELERQVAQCDVLLALIGQAWLGAADEEGALRLENPEDFVRIEIESALLLGKRVIPVLINRVEMPRRAELPEPLAPLSSRNAVRLTQERFRADVQGLIVELEAALRAADASRDTARQAADTEHQTAEAERRRQEQEAAAKAEANARSEKEWARLEALAALSPEHLAKAEELANWDFIKQSPREQDFRSHLARFPAGVTERFARARLDGLVWQRLSLAPDLDGVHAFLAEFPDGKHASQAAELLPPLERQRAIALMETARRSEEALAWSAAEQVGDRATLAAFLEARPQSERAKEARARLKKLETSPTRRRLLWGAGGAAAIAAAGITAGLRPGSPLWRRRDDRPIPTAIVQRTIDEPIRTFTGHMKDVRAVAFSPDGSRVASGASDDTLKLWDLSGKELETFVGHSAPVNLVAFCPATTGLRLVPSITGLGPVPNRPSLLSGSSDHTIKQWDLESGREIKTFTGHADSVNAVAASLDGRAFVSGSGDQTIRVWSLDFGRGSRSFASQVGKVNAVAIAPDRATVLAGGEILKLLDLATGKEVRPFVGHLRSITSVQFSRDGRYALSGSADGSIKLWEVATGQEVKTFGTPQPPQEPYEPGKDKQLRLYSDSSISSAALSPDGRIALSGGRSGGYSREGQRIFSIEVWDVATGEQRGVLHAHSNTINSIAISPDGSTAVSGSADGTIKLWDLTEFKPALPKSDQR